MMRKLAKYHAAMMTLNERKNGALEKSDTLGSYFLHGPFHAFFKEYPYALVEEVKKWGSEFEGIAAKLEKIAGSVIQRFHDATISNRGLNVLAHNDLWYTNVMVKMDKEKNLAEDVLMIDFQLNRWASVTSDLLHICFRCLKREDYENGINYQIEVYHSHLQRLLTKLKCTKVPTLEEILEEVHNNFFHGEEGFLFSQRFGLNETILCFPVPAFYSGIMCRSFTDCKVEKDLVLDDLTNPGKFDFRSQFRDARINEELKITLKWLDRKGALDAKE